MLVNFQFFIGTRHLHATNTPISTLENATFTSLIRNNKTTMRYRGNRLGITSLVTHMPVLSNTSYPI